MLGLVETLAYHVPAGAGTPVPPGIAWYSSTPPMPCVGQPAHAQTNDSTDMFGMIATVLDAGVGGDSCIPCACRCRNPCATRNRLVQLHTTHPVCWAARACPNQ